MNIASMRSGGANYGVLRLDSASKRAWAHITIENGRMTMTRFASFVALVCLAAGAVFAQNLSVGSSTAQIPYPNPFKHIVLVIQENRTPDNLFHGLLSYPGINPANYDLASSGLANVNGQEETIPLVSNSLATDFDLGHGHADFTLMYDKGKMDGANQIPDQCNPTAQDCQNGGKGEFLSYQFVQSSDVQPYLDIAAQYGWANFFFQTNQGPTFAAHQYLFTGTSAQDAESDSEGVLVVGNPQAPKGANYSPLQDTGCLAPLNEYNWLISPQSAPQMYKLVNNPVGSLCFYHDTMATLLDDAGLTWKYYVVPQTSNPYPDDPTKKGYNVGGFLINAPNSIYDICQPDNVFQNCNGPEYTTNVDLAPGDVLTDIANCNLPAVSWVTPIGQASDHPGNVKGNEGPSWVSTVVDAIGNDTSCEHGAGYWSDTAILIMWDDWGGWYDHVGPSIAPGVWAVNEHGFRVPFIAVSAYTPPAFVSNVPHDFGSVLRFVQGTMGFTEGALGFADARATTDLREFFNFKMQPRPFQTINSPRNAEYFINDKRVPDPPDTY